MKRISIIITVITVFFALIIFAAKISEVSFAENSDIASTALEVKSQMHKIKRELHKTLSAVGMILERKNEDKTEVLLQLRKNTGWMDGYWDVGACGHVEEGESLVQAAIREAKEELCIDVLPENVEFVSVNHTKLEEVYYSFYVKIKDYDGEITIGEPHKCEKLQWFDLENLPENMIPIRKSALDDYKNGIIYNELGW